MTKRNETTGAAILTKRKIGDYGLAPCPVCAGKGMLCDIGRATQDRCEFCLGRGTVDLKPNREHAGSVSE